MGPALGRDQDRTCEQQAQAGQGDLVSTVQLFLDCVVGY